MQRVRTPPPFRVSKQLTPFRSSLDSKALYNSLKSVKLQIHLHKIKSENTQLRIFLSPH